MRHEELFPVLRRIWAFHTARVELEVAHGVAERCLRLAERSGDTGLILEAHRVVAVGLRWLGDLALVREHLEKSTGLYDPEEHHRHALLSGMDAGVAARAGKSGVLWGLGYPDMALVSAGGRPEAGHDVRRTAAHIADGIRSAIRRTLAIPLGRKSPSNGSVPRRNGRLLQFPARNLIWRNTRKRGNSSGMP